MIVVYAPYSVQSTDVTLLRVLYSVLRTELNPKLLLKAPPKKTLLTAFRMDYFRVWT